MKSKTGNINEMSIKTPFVIKPIKIKQKNLESALKTAEDLPDISKEYIIKKFNRYKGSFLIFGNNLIRIPSLDFLNYKEVEFDTYDYGVFSSVVHGNFNYGKLHGHFKDGSILDFQRKNYIGKVDTKRYFKQELFNQRLDEIKNRKKNQNMFSS
ncbi:MAG TPA: hypothetical protein VJ912_02120 [Candidatus Nanoarchaeia archaeon]|nr:hypothetical protein [Candidatus Nanoarchaeia archaeon]